MNSSQLFNGPTENWNPTKFERFTSEAKITLQRHQSLNSYSTNERLLSSLTSKLAGSVSCIHPRQSTASLICPQNMLILALRRIKVAPGFTRSTA